MWDAKCTKEPDRTFLSQYCMLALQFIVCYCLVGLHSSFLVGKLFVISFGHTVNGKKNLVTEFGIIH